MLGLKRPSVLSLVLTVFHMWEVSVNVTLAIDGDFDAGRGCRVRASGSLISILLHPCWPAVCGNRCNASECPSFALNLHNGISLPNAERFPLGSTSDGMQLLIRKDWQTVAHQVARELNTKLLLVFASRQDMAREAHGWISGAAKQLLELRCGLSWVLSATNQKLGRPSYPINFALRPGHLCNSLEMLDSGDWSAGRFALAPPGT